MRDARPAHRADHVAHRWKHASILAQAFRHGVPMTVHPGIGYDIIANHPMFNGAAIGRAAAMRSSGSFGGSVETLDGGVVLSVGSAIMGPAGLREEPELRQQSAAAGRPADRRPGHTIYVVDLQDGGGWDWSAGEPPKTNPAYYLRFCKSYARMGGEMHYLQCDNVPFLHNLYHAAGLRMTPERFHAITSRYRGAPRRGRRRFLPRPLPRDRPAPRRDLDRDRPAGPQRRAVRAQPGGAGTIVNNLVALGVAGSSRSSFCGDDGEGYELRRELASLPGVQLDHLVTTPNGAPSPIARFKSVGYRFL